MEWLDPLQPMRPLQPCARMLPLASPCNVHAMHAKKRRERGAALQALRLPQSVNPGAASAFNHKTKARPNRPAVEPF
jgi:hypothetical protein